MAAFSQSMVVKDAVYSEIEGDKGRVYCVRPPLGPKQEFAATSAFQRVTSQRSNDVIAKDERDLVHVPLIVCVNGACPSTGPMLEGDFVIEVRF